MNIVILDDDRTSLLLLKTYVGTLNGCQPVTFTRPVESLEWCTKHDPDLIIVDYLMPKMNGVEFTRQFRSDRRQLGRPGGDGHGFGREGAQEPRARDGYQ